MRVASKIICWIFLAFLLFIIVNLVFWAIQYWWTRNYAEYLNNKDRKDSINQVYILKPKTWLSLFYEIETIKIDPIDTESNKIENIDTENVDSNEILSWDTEDEPMDTNHNPYDPDYEDEFNSFFWVTSEETWEIIPVQEIENLETAWFLVNENTEN